jgi:hypothetical protein
MTSRIGSPRLVAIDMTSFTRSSYSIREAIYSVVAGIAARSASSTELRPVTNSLSSEDFGLRCCRCGAPSAGVALRLPPEAS